MSAPFLATNSNENRSTKPTSGTVHPGVKVLMGKAKAIPGAQEKYDEGVERDVGYDTINKRILAMGQQHNGREWGSKRTVLIPKNAPYFRVFSGDFTNPDNAAKIMELYGEDRGEGRKLYTFPVIFLSNDPREVHSQEFVMWQGGKKSRWSEPDGTDEKDKPKNRCMSLEQIDPSKDPRSKGSRRRFGGRNTINLGPCDPNKCEFYGSGACKLNAALYFYIPGIEGMDPIRLPFTSIYAAAEIGEKLWETVHNHPLGRIAGSFQENPIFWLAKEEREVSQIDYETGEAKKVRQQIIVLDMRIDMAQVVIDYEKRMAIANGEPVQAIGAGEEEPTTSELPEIEAGTVPAPETESEGEYEEPNGQPTQEEAFTKIRECLESLGVTDEAFREWAEEKWNDPEWSFDEKKRGWALDAAMAAVEDDTPESITIQKPAPTDGRF